MPDQVDNLEAQLLVVDPFSNGGGMNLFQNAPVCYPVKVRTQDVIGTAQPGGTFVQQVGSELSLRHSGHIENLSRLPWKLCFQSGRKSSSPDHVWNEWLVHKFHSRLGGDSFHQPG